MSSAASGVPTVYHTLTPYVMVKSAAALIEFADRVFDAKELMRDLDETGRIRHAQIRIGDSVLMLSDETPAFTAMRGVETMGGSPMSLFVEVADADASMARALAAGGSIVYPLADQHYGRSGTFRDPFGLLWHLNTPPKA